MCDPFSHTWRYDHKYARTCTTCGKHQIHWNNGSLPDMLHEWIPAPLILLTLMLLIYIKRWFTTDCLEYEEKLTEIKVRDKKAAEDEMIMQQYRDNAARRLRESRQSCKYAHHKNGE